ncbi:MAG: ABC transporter substrate-binding protein [Actinobacteria bacterium]|nr:ABC transporter substrate-binding protein [Actinomycetota bacterium]
MASSPRRGARPAVIATPAPTARTIPPASTRPEPSRQPRRAALAVVVAAGLVAVSCGRPSGQTEQGGGDQSSSSTTAGGSGTGPGDFGTLEGLCRGGNAGGSTAQGVTSDSIKIATFSDIGFAGRPGLNQELFDAAEVFSKWCNAAGGINGRKIVVQERDAKLFEYKQRVIESCAEDFMMVGGGGVFDDTGQNERLRCLLPDIAGYVVQPKARGADLEVQSVPSPLNAQSIGVYQYLARRFPGSGSAVGYLTGNIPATLTVKNQAQEAAKQGLGFKTVYDERYTPTGEATWTPFAQGMKTKGVKGLVYVGEPENLAKLEQAMASVGFTPQWVVAGPNNYDQILVKTGGGAVKRTFMQVNFVPFEEASKSPALQQYLDLFARYKPSGKARAVLGVQAFSAWLIFAKAAGACGANLTRRCVYDNAKKLRDWNAGGLSAPQRVDQQKTSQCYTVVEASGDGFDVMDVKPTDGLFRCDPKSVVTLKGDYGTGARLADVGRSMSDLK